MSNKHSSWHNSMFEGHGSRIYDHLAPLLIDPLYRYVTKDIVGKLDEGSILDVGAGSGDLAIQIGQSNPNLKITGIDISKDMVKLASKKSTQAGLQDAISFEAQNVSNLTYSDHEFDLVISTISMHHWDDVARGISECARVVKAEGSIWIYDFSLIRHSKIDKIIKQTLREKGFVVQVESIRTGWFPIPIFSRYSALRS